ncbi:MAG: CIA30 family protein [Pseudomonadota bacterium]
MAEELELNAEWEFVADTVMGGVSTGMVGAESVEGRAAARLTGSVSLDNNGGFVQMATTLDASDAGAWRGLRMTLFGNGEAYDVRLRTSDLARPWHSYRTEIVVGPGWETVEVPFSAFIAHRTEIPLDLDRLTRVGIVAIGREFEADIAVSAIALYR